MSSPQLGQVRLGLVGLGLVGLVLLALAAGCGGSDGSTSAPGDATSATPRPDPVSVCTAQLEYWVGQGLQNPPDAGLDYQEMGLTGDQYDALRTIEAEARVQRAAGTLSPSWTADRARSACTTIAAAATATRSSGGRGWP